MKMNKTEVHNNWFCKVTFGVLLVACTGYMYPLVAWFG